MRACRLIFILLSTSVFLNVNAQHGGLNSETYESRLDQYNYSDETPEPVKEENKTEPVSKPSGPAEPETRSSGSWINNYGMIFTTLAVLLIIAGVVLFIVYYQRGLDRKKVKKMTAATSIEHAEKELLDVSLDNLIDQAHSARDLRLLVHLYFLELLQVLHSKEHIIWTPYKTNGQYVLEISDKEVRGQYASVTVVFDRVWYGHKVISGNEFEVWKSNVEELSK